jgi:RNA polymerase sigma factor (sigma-70 family)
MPPVAAQLLNDFVRRVAGDPPSGDADLLRRVAVDRDPTAFRLLLDRHGPAVRAVCRRVLGESADADDAFQATFVVLWQSAHRVKRHGSVGAWLYGTAHRVSCQARIANIRRRRLERNAAAPADEGLSLPDPSWRDVCGALHQELDRLPDRYRLPLVLCYLNGLSRDEAAAQLGWTADSVKGRLERGRKRLRDRLTRRGFGLSASLLAAVVGESIAAVPAALLQSTVRAAEGFASPAVTALVRGAGLAAHSKVIVLAAALGLAAAGSNVTLFVMAGATPAEPPSKPAPPVTNAAKAVAPPSTYRSRIVDSAGHPVPGATVLAIGDVGNGERLSTTTDADGRFTFDRLPVGNTAFPSIRLIVVKPGFAPTEKLLTTTTQRPALLTLRPAATIGGIVKDSAGRPVAGAEVQVGSVHRSGNSQSWGFLPEAAVRGTAAERFYFTKTDPAGRFTFDSVAPDSEVIFRVVANGYGELTEKSGPTPGHVVRDAAAPAEFTLAPEAIIRGEIGSDVPGVSPAAVEVRIDGTQELHGFHRTLKADAGGRFAVARLPAGPMAAFLNLPPNAAATAAGARVTTEPGKTDEVKLRIIPGVEVVGRVVERDSGEPVPGAFMATNGSVNPVGFHFGGQPTDAQGRFVLRLPPGHVQIMVWRPPDGYRQADFRRKEVDVPAGAGRLELPEPFELVKPDAGDGAAAGAARPARSLPGKPGPNGPPLPVPAEQAAAATVRQFGGWYTLDADGHVVEVNMVYHEEPGGRRQDNALVDSDAALRVASSFPRLNRLLLSHGQATDDGLVALVGLAALEELYVWDADKVSDAGIVHLAGLPKLRNLHISNGLLGDASLAVLAKIPSLQSLSLQRNAFGDAGLEHLAGMTQLRALWVGMSKRPITDAGVRHLSGLTALERLDLQHAKLTGAGLAGLKNLTKLQALYLEAKDGDGFADADIEPLLGLGSLRTLDLGTTRLTDRGLLQLATLPELRFLTLSGVFSEEALHKIQKEHPALRLRVSKRAKKG